jgi:cytochrome c-type biogenesis protein CcsB
VPGLSAAGAGAGSLDLGAQLRGYEDDSVMLREPPAVIAAAERGDAVARWLATLPSLARLDMLTYRIVALGALLLGVGIVTGAAWAKEAWGAYWQWDPKETAALTSWIFYLAYLHLHTRRAWQGLRCSWVSLLGFASILFCYLGVNIWISGLHSYKM